STTARAPGTRSSSTRPTRSRCSARWPGAAGRGRGRRGRPRFTLHPRASSRRWPRCHSGSPPPRDLLEQVGVPWIIENVPGASLRPDIRLCGCQFGLTLPGVGYLKRERWFETSWHGFYLEMPHVHRGRAISIAGHGTPSWMREKAGHIGVAEWRQVMGVDWTTRAELTEALPPAFTKYVGGLLLERVAFKEAA